MKKNKQEVTWLVAEDLIFVFLDVFTTKNPQGTESEITVTATTGLRFAVKHCKY